jgi:integrase
MPSLTAARNWGQERERYLLQHGPPKAKREVPTLETFAPRFMDGYARANRQKPSGIAAKDTILRVHLVPALGSKRLDAITNEAVQRLKHDLRSKSVKTVNNVLTVLNVLLKKAVEWEVIERMPCNIRLLPIPNGSAGFYDFDEFERLVTAAESSDPVAHLIVLLGGEAGLRCGEIWVRSLTF